MTETQDIVGKLWSLCHVLRDDGVTYQQYVTELTFLIFLKMASETGAESELPKGWRWADLEKKDGVEQLNFYREMLLHLGTKTRNARVKAIFANASTTIRQPRNLTKLITSIEELNWFSKQRERIGELYEGLLERNASEVKSGAGQHFTPRPLIECMVNLIQPRPGEQIQDPAVGTAGFLIAADHYIKSMTDNLHDLPQRKQEFQIREAFYGVELVADTHRLALMNCMLHGIEAEIKLGDTLSPDGKQLPSADVILTNPPFGTKSNGDSPRRDDFTYPTSNKQLSFLQHIYRNLKPGGRAAVVLPDNVLFEEGVGTRIREDWMNKCDVHTLLRLPVGIFYAKGVKTNAVFFTKGTSTDKGNTKKVWVYDLRADMPSFGKRIPLMHLHFADFEKAFGKDPLGKSKRTDQGEEGRFRCFTRDEIRARGDDLNISWLKGSNGDSEDDLQEPEEIAAAILAHLQTATEEMQKITELLASANGSEA